MLTGVWGFVTRRKLTQEEFERRQKETRLTEVDGKAVQAEEELRAYKLRIQEVEEELQKTERSYKTQVSANAPSQTLALTLL